MTCQQCGGTLSSEARFCPVCGNPVAASETPVSPVAASETPVSPVVETPPAQPLAPVEETPQPEASPEAGAPGEGGASADPQAGAAPEIPYYAPPPLPGAPIQQDPGPAQQTLGPQAQPPYGPQPAGAVPPQGYYAPPGAPPPAPPRKSRKLLVMGGCGLAVVALAVALVVIFTGNSGNYIPWKGDYLAARQDENLIFIDRETLAVLDFGEYDNGIYSRSLDGSAFLIMEEDNNYLGTLWYFTKGEKTKISDDVAGHILADTGTGAVYISDYSSRRESGRLNLFDAKAGSSTRIAEDVQSDFFCISPDGKTVCYVDEDDMGWIYSAGNKRELGEGVYPIAVADGGRFIYYFQDDNGFYVRSGEEVTKLSSDSTWNLSITFTADYSQVVFTHNGRGYISVSGGDRERISSSGGLRSLSPEAVPGLYKYSPSYSYYYQVSGYQSFAGSVFYDEDKGLWYLDGGFDAVQLVDEVGDALYVTNDRKIYYLDTRSDLMVCDLTAKEPEPERLVRYATRLSVSPDGKQLYYIDRDDHLFHYSGGDSVSLDRGVENMMAVGGGLFYTLEGRDALYYSANGDTPVEIDSMEDIRLVRMRSGVCYYAYSYTSDEYDLYYTDGGEPVLLVPDCWNLY